MKHFAATRRPRNPLPYLLSPYDCLIISSRKRDEFRISRQSIGADVILREALFGIQPSGLVEPDPSGSHDPLHLPFTVLVQAGTRIPRRHVSLEIECAGREARVDIGREGARETGIDVVRDGDVRKPSCPGDVEYLCGRRGQLVWIESGKDD